MLYSNRQLIYIFLNLRFFAALVEEGEAEGEGEAEVNVSSATESSAMGHLPEEPPVYAPTVEPRITPLHLPRVNL